MLWERKLRSSSGESVTRPSCVHIELQKKYPNLTDDTDYSHYKISSLKQSAVFKCMLNKEACSIDFRQESVFAATIIREKNIVSSVCPIYTVSALLSHFTILLRYNSNTYIYTHGLLVKTAFWYSKFTVCSVPSREELKKCMH